MDQDQHAPLSGWAPRGARLPAKVPWGHWNTMTFIAALRHDRIDAPWLLDGPINGERFHVYVEQVLAPTLGAGDVLGKCRSRANAAGSMITVPVPELRLVPDDLWEAAKARQKSWTRGQAGPPRPVMLLRPRSGPSSARATCSPG
jgi:hypothetical protein